MTGKNKGSKAGKGYLESKEKAFTVGATQDQWVFENHPADSRVEGPIDVGNAVTSRYGTGGGNVPFVAKAFRKSRRAQSKADHETWVEGDMANTINTFDVGDVRSTNLVSASAVRRLTTIECARLQGFPDNYLDIPFRNKPAGDGVKYKALGNSMAVPCMLYIGMRLEEADKIQKGEK